MFQFVVLFADLRYCFIVREFVNLGYNEYEGWIKDKMNKEQVGRGQVVLYLRNNLMLGSKQRVRKNVNL